MRLESIAQLAREKRIHDALQGIDEAISAYADNPSLWIMRGDLIQLVDSAPLGSLTEAERSYHRALELDPDNLEAIESLAHYYDAVGADPAKAKEFAAKYIGVSGKKCAEMSAILSEASWIPSHAPHHR
jgi:predicted Zn-dependent protease